MKSETLVRGTYLIAMTLLLSMFSIINLPTKALATENIMLEAAPLNPAYIEYLTKAHSDNSSDLLKSTTNKLGYVPSPFSLFGGKQLTTEKALLESSQLPSSYDLRTKNKLTPVRDQGGSGSCWAFATYGSLESTLKTTESADFSENNLKNRAGFDLDHNGGGNADMSIAYLSRWDGPVSEKDDPYLDSSTFSPEKFAQKHVQEALRFGDVDNNHTDIKKALMNNGAIFTAMRYQDNNYNSKYKTYYYRGSEKPNHAVTIVGWDDNFDRSKFSDTGAGIPPVNGAFIIRNSWGSSWGDNGYFYVSYYDSLIGSDNVVFNSADRISNYSSVYQYDPLGQTTPVQFSSNPNTAWLANVFTATSNDALSAVSFYTNGPNSKYEVWLYNYNKGALTKNKSLSSGTIDYAGYHTVKLANSLELTTGGKFTIAVKLTTPGENPYPLALEEPIAGYSSQAKSEKGQSFVSGDGVAWTDLNDTTSYSNANVCLKAFTSAKSINSLKVDPSSVTLLQGENQAITVQAVNSEGITEDVTSLVEPSSSNSKVASVNSGKIEGIGPGKATITLTYLGKKVTVSVLVLPTFDLQASLNPITIEKQKSVKVKIVANYSTGKSEDITTKVTWTINPFDTQNVSIDKGTLTGVIVGETKVTVSYLGKNLSLPVIVIAPLTTLTAIPNTIAIASGDQSTPQVIATYGKEFEEVSTKCTAVSSKLSVATVTNGVIQGLSPGTAVITYTYGSKVTTIKVNVIPKLTKLEVDKPSLTLEVKKQATLKLKALYSTGKTTDVTKKALWTIDPGGEKYISISSGKITALSAGTTQLTVSYQDQTITISVTVLPQLIGIKADPLSITLSPKDEFTPKIMANYLSETAADVVTQCEGTSSNQRVAIVSEGKITAVTRGTCTIKYVYGSKNTTVRVKVI